MKYPLYMSDEIHQGKPYRKQETYHAILNLYVPCTVHVIFIIRRFDCTRCICKCHSTIAWICVCIFTVIGIVTMGITILHVNINFRLLFQTTTLASQSKCVTLGGKWYSFLCILFIKECFIACLTEKTVCNFALV